MPANHGVSRPAAVAYAPVMDASERDSELMVKYRDGDDSAFEVLYRRHKDSLYRYLLRLCYQKDVAEDLYQDVWSKIIRARHSYRRTAKFTTFLYRVAYNCFIDNVRRNKKHQRNFDGDPTDQASNDENIEMLVERSLARRRLEAALGSLPDEQRDAFLLHEEAGLSIDQIASVTDANRETAKSRLRYAVKKLRAALNEPEVMA